MQPRVPRHIGFIPDGNRRWAEARGLPRQAGYNAGIEPGLRLLERCEELGVDEVSAYAFTKENVRRPGPQVQAFREASTTFALAAVDAGAALLVVGDTESQMFPDALRPFTERRAPGRIRFNLLVNYSWRWDLSGRPSRRGALPLRSAGVARVDLVVRWGGRQRLSGFLPIQCAYADFAFSDTLWPDMRVSELSDALAWYSKQDVTLGG
jgi:undecaprenyl diphosphate synthase